MKRIVLFLLAVVMVAGMAGCANIGVTKMKEATPYDVGCKLDIYTSVNEIKRPYEIVCLINSRTGSTAFHTKTAAAAIEQVKPEACKCGADALLIENIDTEGVSWGGWGKGKAILKAIRYTDN